MPDVLTNIGALELLLTAVGGMVLVVVIRRGPSYWPAFRLLAAIFGIRGVYYILLRILFYQQSTEHYLQIAQSPMWRGLYVAFELGGLLWVLWIVVRTNRKGHEVNLLGRDDE